MIVKILDWIFSKFGLNVKKAGPRGCTLFCARHFNNRPITVCEIGVQYGNHALELLKHLNITAFYAVDPYEKYDDYKGDGSYERTTKAEGIMVKKLERYPVYFIKERSDSVEIPSCDMIYVDGNHYYDYVLADMEKFYPLVKEGGILAGHDIGHEKYDVSEALQEFCKRHSLKFRAIGCDWIIIK